MSSPRFDPRRFAASPPWWLVLASLLIADMMYGFQQTAITPALPVLQRDLGASQEWTTWVFSGYLIVASVMPLFGGKVADRIGRRRVLLIALAVFALGSITAGLAPSIGVVVVGRLIQGVGGIVFPLTFSIVREHLPKRRVRDAVGILTGGFGFGGLAGFGLGGALTEFMGWRWVFGIGAIVLLAAIVLVRIFVPKGLPRTVPGLDTPGALLLGSAIALLIVTLTEAPQRGWSSPLSLGGFALVVLTGAGWVLRELHTHHPLMDVRVFTSRTVLLTNLASLLAGYAVFSVNILLPYLLVNGAAADAGYTAFGLTAGPLLTGIVLVPRALGQSIGGPIVGPLSRRLGPAAVFALGLLIQAASAGALAMWREQVWALLLELALLGVGFGISISAAGGIVTLAASEKQTGIAASLNSVVRRAGGGVGAQIATALLVTMTIPGTDTPAHAAFTVAFALAAAVSVIGAALALLATPLRRSPAHGHVPPDHVPD